MRLSVIMPTRNSGHYLRTAVGSTLRAMPRDSELLVYDDASDDDSIALLNDLHDPRIRLFSGDAKVGVAAALNTLLDEARGVYVARMDADDVCLPHRFALQLNAVQDESLSFAPALAFSSFGLPRLRAPGQFSTRFHYGRLLTTNPYIHPSLLAKRDLLISLGGYDASCSAEDYELWLRAAARGTPVQTLRAPVLLYRVHRAQASYGQRLEGLLRDPRLTQSWATLYTKLTCQSPPLSLSEGGLRSAWADLEFQRAMLEYASRLDHARERLLMSDLVKGKTS